MSLVIKNLEEEIRTLIQEAKELKKEIEPTKQTIKHLIKSIEIIQNKIYEKSNKVEELKARLRIIKSRVFIDDLKIGDKICILHYRKGLYKTISEEQAKKRFRMRQEGETIPHQITITSVSEGGDDEFIAKDERTGIKYFGEAKRLDFVMTRKGEWELNWRRIY